MEMRASHCIFCCLRITTDEATNRDGTAHQTCEQRNVEDSRVHRAQEGPLTLQRMGSEPMERPELSDREKTVHSSSLTNDICPTCLEEARRSLHSVIGPPFHDKFDDYVDSLGR